DNRTPLSRVELAWSARPEQRRDRERRNREADVVEPCRGVLLVRDEVADGRLSRELWPTEIRPGSLALHDCLIRLDERPYTDVVLNRVERACKKHSDDRTVHEYTSDSGAPSA